MEEQPQILEGGKRIEARDLGSVLRIGGMQKCSNLTEAEVDNHQGKEKETSQNTSTSASLHSNEPVQLMTHGNPVAPSTSACLSLSLAGSLQSSANPIKADKPDSQKMIFTNLNLDLNEKPFQHDKKLEQFRPTDASECSSTNGPSHESNPLKLWREMKQNGFLSSSHGGIPVPKRRGRPPKRKKDDGLLKKSDITKREYPYKYSKDSAPTGLLSGLDPRIIRHVRNKKQVNSILKAVVESERSDAQMQNMNANQIGSESEDVISHSSAGDQSSLYYRPLFSGSDHESSTLPRLILEDDDDSLNLKLSSAVSIGSENASNTSNDEFSADYDTIASLSMKGASVASQWLDLLQQDIKGRLAALQRSKKRLRNVFQTELPYLLSVELSDREKDGYFEHSSESACSMKASLDVHMEKWKSIFSQMDKALYEEGNHLENWLKQVQVMQSHCEGGLKYFGTSLTMSLAEEFSGLKKAEAIERENAVRAAAASIYSTSNLIMSEENVSGF
ncbi:uncharacterized protein A4U43_C05F5450 [Asparagus officinalis]|uniref:Uncharacterized protein n=1 Tax=Asparagus officinalis TaxID=4686 RepID=A0A5P1ETR9_ASPOF|nr:uncharacterized protein LOC109843362 [Asparagus officinalis]ONK67941.1 uncharacterized protein A4U43_C05F5450 [Asparagus officinalis]